MTYAVIYDTGPADQPSENYYAHFDSVDEAKRMYAGLHLGTNTEYRGAYVVQIVEAIPSPGDAAHDLEGHGKATAADLELALRALLEWEANMGGFESRVWRNARALMGVTEPDSGDEAED